MRLTILAGLIMGMSLAIHSALGTHARAKVGQTVKAVGVHVRVVAPWYIAMNVGHVARQVASKSGTVRRT